MLKSLENALTFNNYHSGPYTLAPAASKIPFPTPLELASLASHFCSHLSKPDYVNETTQTTNERAAEISKSIALAEAIFVESLRRVQERELLVRRWQTYFEDMPAKSFDQMLHQKIPQAKAPDRFRILREYIVATQKTTEGKPVSLNDVDKEIEYFKSLFATRQITPNEYEAFWSGFEKWFSSYVSRKRSIAAKAKNGPVRKKKKKSH